MRSVQRVVAVAAMAVAVVASAQVSSLAQTKAKTPETQPRVPAKTTAPSKAAAPASQTSSAEQAVLQAEKDRFTAMHESNAALLEKLLAPELSYTHSNAAVQDKAAFIGDIKSGAIRYLMIEPSDMKARVFGTTAVVTGGASVHVIQNGNDLTFKIRYTNVHVNRNGGWQMVAWQATRLPA